MRQRLASRHRRFHNRPRRLRAAHGTPCGDAQRRHEAKRTLRPRRLIVTRVHLDNLFGKTCNFEEGCQGPMRGLHQRARRSLAETAGQICSTRASGRGRSGLIAFTVPAGLDWIGSLPGVDRAIFASLRQGEAGGTRCPTLDGWSSSRILPRRPRPPRGQGRAAALIPLRLWPGIFADAEADGKADEFGILNFTPGRSSRSSRMTSMPCAS